MKEYFLVKLPDGTFKTVMSENIHKMIIHNGETTVFWFDGYGTVVELKQIADVGGLKWERTKDFGIEEVLAPVPSYDEHCNLVFQANKPRNPLSDVMMCYDTEREKKVVEPLQKKLEIATKALEDMPEMSRAQRALKEMEGVK